MNELSSSRSRSVALVAMFTAMTVALDSMPMIPGFYSGIWDSWVFLLSPLIGILLGPSRGAASVGLGSVIGHMVYPRDPFEFVFMVGAPVGAAVAGLVYRGRWVPTLGLYTALLGGYFLTPVSWSLPLWGVWDVLAGYGLLLVLALILSRGRLPAAEHRRDMLMLFLSIVIGLEADILARVFVLIPCQTYWLFYGLTIQQLQLIWLGAGFVTLLKVAVAAAFGAAVGVPVLRLQSGSTSLED